MGSVRQRVDEIEVTKKKKVSKKKDQVIKEKQKDVEKKIKSGKKLTTEDLLMFQKN